MRPLVLLAAASAGLLIAGCGKMGDLERPGPLFGQPGPAGEDAPRNGDATKPVQTVDPRDDTRDPTSNPAPPRTVPIQGSGQDVTRPGPQGVLPDPYANPSRR